MSQYRALFRNRNFLFLWSAGAISNIGDFFNSVALVKILSEDPEHLGFYMSLIMISKVVPSLLLGPVAGALADRLPRRAIMVTADLLRAALVLGLVFVEEPAAIITLVALSATFSAFYGPASSAMLPSLVSKEELITAGSLSVMTQRTAMLLGNGLGAAVLMAVGPHNVFYIDSASFVLSAVLLSFIAAPAVVRTASQAGSLWGKFKEDMRETAAFLKQAPAMRHLMTAIGIAGLGDSAFSVLLVTFFTLSLGMAAEKMGFVWALFGGASLIGALAIGAIGNRAHWRHLFIAGALYVWVMMVGALVTAGVVSSTAFLVLMGLGSGAVNVGLQAAVGQLVPNEVRGRVFGTWNMVQSFIFVIGVFSAGLFSDRFGPEKTLLGYSTFYLIAGLYAFVTLRRVPRDQESAPVAVAGD